MRETMRAIEIKEPGGPDVLQETTRPVPAPGLKEVRIKVAAAGVNRPDVLQRMGLYPPPPGASDLPGLEVAGYVDKVGENVAAWNIGDPVCALLTGGGYAEYAIAHEGSCLPTDGMTLKEAAGLPETLFTVWANVFEAGALKTGETLLVHGGTSGIGVTTIQLAKARGAKVIASAYSAEKRAACLAQGADAAIDYTSDDWESEVNALGGADVVLDMTGGDFLSRNLSVLKPGGRHVSIAFLRGAEAKVNIMQIMRNRLTLTGSTMKARSFEEKAALAARIRLEALPFYASGQIKPHIDRTFKLEEAAEAHRLMEKGGHIGKIVLTTGVE
ncbi:MAG: NAD(P)H-quinone oxidoreductase [Pseudomonadota bacterium]